MFWEILKGSEGNISVTLISFHVKAALPLRASHRRYKYKLPIYFYVQVQKYSCVFPRTDLHMGELICALNPILNQKALSVHCIYTEHSGLKP